MNSEDALRKLETLKIGYTESNFFKYVQSGDRELVELFLDAGFPPDVRNGDRQPAVLVASKSGKQDIARLLLARGASPEPLLEKSPQGKDMWDKISASSGVLSFISGILIAAVGGYFTYSYNQRQIDLNRTQSEHDASTKEQSNKVLELEAVQKLIPTLTSTDEKSKAAALIAIQDLAHPELAAHLAVLFKGTGSVQYLQQAASSTNPQTKQAAVQALSTLAVNGPNAETQLASDALRRIFDNTRFSVVQVVVEEKGNRRLGSGLFVTNGYILTVAALLQAQSGAVEVRTASQQKLAAHIVNVDPSLDLAILKLDGPPIDPGLTPTRLASSPVTPGSTVISIGYARLFLLSQEASLVGTVTAIDEHYLYYTAPTNSGMAGGPVLGTTGEVVGIVSKYENVSMATRSDLALKYLSDHGIHFANITN